MDGCAMKQHWKTHWEIEAKIADTWVGSQQRFDNYASAKAAVGTLCGPMEYRIVEVIVSETRKPIEEPK